MGDKPDSRAKRDAARVDAAVAALEAALTFAETACDDTRAETAVRDAAATLRGELGLSATLGAVTRMKPTKDELARALRAAGDAHHDYELNALKGERDGAWPGWYAAYVLGRLGDFTTPTHLARWLSDAAGDDWPDAAARAVLDRLV